MDSLNSIPTLDVAKKRYIECLENSIRNLETLEISLQSQINGCKVANTTGNGLSIAGTAMMLNPISFFAGMAVVGIGTLTSIGASMSERKINNQNKEKLMQILKEEEVQQEQYLNILEHLLSDEENKASVGIASGATKGLFITQKLNDLKKMYDVSRGYRVAYNGVNGVSNAMKAGTKLGSFSKVLGGVGVVFSAADIYMTWHNKNETIEVIKKLIEQKKTELLNLKNIN